MGSSQGGAPTFALGLAARAVAIGLLAIGAFELAVARHLFATALIVAGVAALVGLDLARAIGAADRTLAVFLGALGAGVVERPPARIAGFPALAGALRETADRLEAGRLEQHRRVDALEALLDTVTAALIVVRPDGTVTLANRAARQFAGDTPTRLTDFDRLGGEAAAQLERLEPGGREIVRLADGRRMLAFAAQIQDPGEGRRRLISLQSLSGELDVVEQQAWRDLARVLAHEMLNSLTPISSLAESLGALLRPRDGEAPDAAIARRAEVVEAVDVIARRSTGLMNFVERYRRVADLPAPQPRRLDAAAFLAGLDRLMAPTMAEAGIAYESAVETRDLSVFADPDLLEQALINLLKNAMDAVDGAPSPRITLTCAEGEGATVFRIADVGRGLPDEPDRIFLPFFTTKPAGSGIGLSLARQIALAHQGRLTAEANKPRGAVFVLSLPDPGAS